MRRSRIVVAAVVVLVGLVWIGQGMGLIGGSAMSGSPFWAVVGTVLVIAGSAIALREPTRRPITRP